MPDEGRAAGEEKGFQGFKAAAACGKSCPSQVVRMRLVFCLFMSAVNPQPRAASQIPIAPGAQLEARLGADWVSATVLRIFDERVEVTLEGG